MLVDLRQREMNKKMALRSSKLNVLEMNCFAPSVSVLTPRHLITLKFYFMFRRNYNVITNIQQVVQIFSFLIINTEFLKLHIICRGKKSVLMCESSVYFCASHFRVVPLHFVCSGDSTGKGGGMWCIE